MRIDLPKGYEGVENLPKTKRVLQNCFNDGKGNIIGRAGIVELNDTGKVARGSFEWNGSLYHVISQTLVKITDKTTGTYSTVGTIEGSNPIRFAIGFNHAVIVVKSGKLYTLDSSDTLTDISGNTNFVPCVDVCHINGRFVYIPANGDPAFFSDIGAAGTVQALSYFDAEALPDKNNACFNFKETLYIAGTDSIQPFRDTGASPNPFLSSSGSRLLNGFIGGLLEYNNTWLFVGKEKGQDFGIYSIAQGLAPKISNEAIDLILSTYTPEELAETTSGRMKWRGYDIATFALRRHSFGYFGGNWFLLDTVFDGISRPWGAGYITEFEGEYFTNYNSKLGKFSKVNTDYGESITRRIKLGIEQEDGEYFSIQSLKLGISQGYNSADASVALIMSRDGVTKGQPIYRNLGKIGQYGYLLEWNIAGGLGTYQGFAGVEFYTTEDCDFSISSLSMQ